MTLRSYQREIVNFALQHERCAIWADPGMGKTRSMLELLRALYLIEGPLHVLVIAPLAVAKYTWPEQAREWTPECECKYLSFEPGSTEGVVIDCINYERIPQWVREHSETWPYQVIVADESTKLKRFRLRQGAKRAGDLAKVAFKSKYFFELTGTPAPNGLLDLWGQFWFLDKGQRLGRTYSAFERRWFTVGYDGFTKIPTESADRDITGRIQDLCLSVHAKDYLDIPQVVHQTIPVELPEIARGHYRELEKKYLTQIEDEDHEAFNAASKTNKLLQMASGAIYTHDDMGEVTGYQELHYVKLEALQDLTEEYQEPLIVAYWYQFDLARLQKRFPQARTLKDKKSLDAWNRGEIDMLLLHPGSAGHGLNLQHGGRAICFFSDWWDLEKHDQIIERIGPARQAQLGRKDPVMVYQLVARNTLDEAVLERQRSKAKVQDIIRAYIARPSAP